MNTIEINRRLELLESKLAFQEATIESLNQTVVALHLESARLKEQLRLLSEKLHATQGSNIALQSEETPPPHY